MELVKNNVYYQLFKISLHKFMKILILFQLINKLVFLKYNFILSNLHKVLKIFKIMHIGLVKLRINKYVEKYNF